MQAQYDGWSFTLASELLRLRGGPPSVELVSASGDWRFRWTVTGKGDVSHCSRPSPHAPGLCHEQTHRWTHNAGYELLWTITHTPALSAVTLAATFRNGSTEPVRLAELRLIDPDTSELSLRSSIGTSSRSRATKSRSSSTDRWFATHLMNIETPTTSDLSEARAQGKTVSITDALFLYQPGAEHCFTAGAVGPGESDVRFDIVPRGKGLSLGIASDMTEVLVQPGGSRRSEEVLLIEGTLLQNSDLLFRCIGQTMGTRTHRGSITGWCSWYDLLSKITAEHVINVAQAISQDRQRLGVDVMQIDEGYQRRWGDWRPNPQKFPDGWKPVVDAIRAADATPGVWIAPLGVHDDLGMFKSHPDWFQHQLTDGKPPTIDWAGHLSFLDPTHPDVQRMLENIIHSARGEGFEYFKIDFNFISPCRFYDPTKTRFEVMRDLYRLYRRTMGEAVYLNACVFGLVRAVVGLADAARIAGDSMAMWSWIHRARPRAIFNLPAHGRLFANDPDVSYALSAENTKASGRSMNRDELQTWHSTVGLTGGLTMTSEPWHLPEFQSDEARRMWEIVRPPAAERAVAWGATPTDPQQPRLGFIAERAWGRFACVQLFNHQDCPGDVALRTAELDPLGKKFHAWSFWDRKYLGVISPAFVARKLPAHGSMLLRLTPVESDGKPVLVGSDLHVAMGSTEVADWTFDGERLIVTLTPGAGARQGSLWIHSDKKLSFANDPGSASCDATLQRPKRGCPGVWRLDIGRGTSSVDRVTMQVTPSGKRRAIPLPKLPSLNVAMTCSEEPTWLLGSASRTKARAMLRMESSDGAAWKGLIRISIEPASAATGFPRQIDAHVASERAFERAIDLDIEQGVRRVTVVASLAPPVAKSLGLSAVEPAGSSRLSSITLRPRPFVTIPRDRSTTVTLSPQGMAATNVQLRASERGLHVEARVCDLKVTPGEPIWAGSCLELFAAKETQPTAIAQVFLSPGDDRKPARAMLAKGLEQVPAEDVRVEASPLTRGYTLAAMIPWSRLALASAESGPVANWLLELQLTTYGPLGQTRATAAGSTEAYAKSDLYVRVNCV